MNLRTWTQKWCKTHYIYQEGSNSGSRARWEHYWRVMRAGYSTFSSTSSTRLSVLGFCWQQLVAGPFSVLTRPTFQASWVEFKIWHTAGHRRTRSEVTGWARRATPAQEPNRPFLKPGNSGRVFIFLILPRTRTKTMHHWQGADVPASVLLWQPAVVLKCNEKMSQTQWVVVKLSHEKAPLALRAKAQRL